ncbi:nuclear transport factor 2 family protein [Flavobacterium sp.]|uniref:nuclear transport factor 2 family protein n=1 Tax=Flavobacterium sp. TaxID=239 RepID=UPI0039E6F2DA
MKKAILILFVLISHGILAQEAEVKKAIETFFEGFHQRDTVKMQSVFAKEMVLHSVGEKKEGAKLSVESVSQFSKSIASIPKDMSFEEKLLSWKIQIDGSLAHVWTPYEFYINGKLSHSGVNSFQLFKDKAGWKITYCIDTRRRP